MKGVPILLPKEILIPLVEMDSNQIERIGAKGRSLAVLHNKGFLIPKTYVLSTNVTKRVNFCVWGLILPLASL